MPGGGSLEGRCQKRDIQVAEGVSRKSKESHGTATSKPPDTCTTSPWQHDTMLDAFPQGSMTFCDRNACGVGNPFKTVPHQNSERKNRPGHEPHGTSWVTLSRSSSREVRIRVPVFCSLFYVVGEPSPKKEKGTNGGPSCFSPDEKNKNKKWTLRTAGRASSPPSQNRAGVLQGAAVMVLSPPAAHRGPKSPTQTPWHTPGVLQT